MIELFLFVLLGSSLLFFVEEREWQTYVKLALFIIFTTSIASLLA
ncbi:hypothetical protein MKX47_11945 [Solibacillus sp. FSL R7-0668]